MNMFSRQGAVLIAAGGHLILISSSAWLDAAPMDFTLDPARNAITISGSAAGLPLTEQAAGSLRTSFTGTLKADVSATAIQFTGGSVIDARTNGNWQPLPGGAAGSAPADFGGRGGNALVTATAALRDIVLDGTSAPLTLTNGIFNSGGIVFGFPTTSAAAFDYRATGFVSGMGSRALKGLSANNVTGIATLTNSGGTLTLTIPVSAQFFFNVLASNDGNVTLTGALVATASGPPPLLVSPATVKVQGGMVSFSWQAAAGLTFRVESSFDLVTWTTRQAGITSATTTYMFSGPAGGPKEYFRLVQ